jgi:hypothetical protein
MAPKAEKAEETTAARGGYTVFVRNDVTGEWRVAGGSEAASQLAAIKEVSKEAEGTYAAVPTRSWHPVTIQVTTTTRAVFVDSNGSPEAEAAEEQAAEEA